MTGKPGRPFSGGPKPRYCNLCGKKMLVFKGLKGYRFKCPDPKHDARKLALKRRILAKARKKRGEK
jgi:hypothetical protein